MSTRRRGKIVAPDGLSKRVGAAEAAPGPAQRSQREGKSHSIAARTRFQYGRVVSFAQPLGPPFQIRA